MKLDNMLQEIFRVTCFIKEVYRQAGKTEAVIGLSGGIDSAVVAALLVRALGKENVHSFLLPYHLQKDASDAGSYARKLGISFEVINIGDIVDMTAQYSDIDFEDVNDRMRLGNIKARVRMMFLYDLSALHNALVAGTGNKTELLLGYVTIHGDGACALEPIGHLYKTQVKHLARYLEVPEKIINKAPSAGLWDGQTDEEELGISYEKIDKYLDMIDRNKFKDEPAKRLI